MELICGACQGRLLVELPGTTVACPHCGTYLQTPTAGAPSAPFFPGPDDGSANGPDPAEDTVRLNPWEIPGAASRVTPPPESFLNKSVPAAMAAPPSESPSSSSIDLDAGHSEAAPLIRVSEAGSIGVSTGRRAQRQISQPSRQTFWPSYRSTTVAGRTTLVGVAALPRPCRPRPPRQPGTLPSPGSAGILGERRPHFFS